jgi:hypothetical protein
VASEREKSVAIFTALDENVGRFIVYVSISLLLK